MVRINVSRFKATLTWLFFVTEDISSEQHPLDLCTKRSNPFGLALTNNNIASFCSQVEGMQKEHQKSRHSRNSNTNVNGHNKTIWSPASSCEEENEQKLTTTLGLLAAASRASAAAAAHGMTPSGSTLSCPTCQRKFLSPSKLQVHCKKVHGSLGGPGDEDESVKSSSATSSTTATTTSTSTSGRRERIFKVSKLFSSPSLKANVYHIFMVICFIRRWHATKT